MVWLRVLPWARQRLRGRRRREMIIRIYITSTMEARRIIFRLILILMLTPARLRMASSLPPRLPIITFTPIRLLYPSISRSWTIISRFRISRSIRALLPVGIFRVLSTRSTSGWVDGRSGSSSLLFSSLLYSFLLHWVSSVYLSTHLLIYLLITM